MIVRGESTIDYHAPFDQGLKASLNDALNCRKCSDAQRLGLVSFLVLSSTAVYYFTPVSLGSASVSLLG